MAHDDLFHELDGVLIQDSFSYQPCVFDGYRNLRLPLELGPLREPLQNLGLEGLQAGFLSADVE